MNLQLFSATVLFRTSPPPPDPLILDLETKDMAITTTRKLLTGLWTADVEAVETAIGRFQAKRGAANDCEVALFEVVRDGNLHVNVTHQHKTRTAPGWAGPASMPKGFVHNRTFDETRPRQIVSHIREMVFAPLS